MQIITSPSKTQLLSSHILQDYSQPLFPQKARKIIDVLRKLSAAELGALLGTSENLTLSARNKIKAFTLPFTLQNSKQAICTFQGDAYSAINQEMYSSEQLSYAQNTLFILSGLYGILRPLDLMQPYRLEMGTRLQIEDCKNLYEFWREPVTGTIRQSLGQHEDRTLVNLASSEYARVVTEKQLQARMVTITFKQKSGAGYKSVPIYAKRARGMMIHHSIINGIKTAERLKDFRLDGYNYSMNESTDTNWVFLQE
jgi:cytoplasmic iron level regulating protein YaaA (DUF328/UPF0246 family)